VRAQPRQRRVEELPVERDQLVAGRGPGRVRVKQQEPRVVRTLVQAPAEVCEHHLADACARIVTAAGQRVQKALLVTGERCRVHRAGEGSLAAEMVVDAPHAGAAAGPHVLDGRPGDAVLEEAGQPRGENLVASGRRCRHRTRIVF
jgi:hypothetical protein